MATLPMLLVLFWFISLAQVLGSVSMSAFKGRINVKRCKLTWFSGKPFISACLSVYYSLIYIVYISTAKENVADH